MICKKCNLELEDNVAFCPKCGCKVERNDVQNVSIGVPSYDTAKLEGKANVIQWLGIASTIFELLFSTTLTTRLFLIFVSQTGSSQAYSIGLRLLRLYSFAYPSGFIGFALGAVAVIMMLAIKPSLVQASLKVRKKADVGFKLGIIGAGAAIAILLTNLILGVIT